MVEDMAYALYVLHSDEARKVSEEKQKSLEGQLIQARKMESVGRLAGGRGGTRLQQYAWYHHGLY